MIDAAYPDKVEDGMINFEKRRKEFEVLAQIKLLQSAANMYTIIPDNRFKHWWNSAHVFLEDERQIWVFYLQSVAVLILYYVIITVNNLYYILRCITPCCFCYRDTGLYKYLVSQPTLHGVFYIWNT